MVIIHYTRGNGLQEWSPSYMKICYLQFFEEVGNRKVKLQNAIEPVDKPRTTSATRFLTLNVRPTDG